MIVPVMFLKGTQTIVGVGGYPAEDQELYDVVEMEEGDPAIKAFTDPPAQQTAMEHEVLLDHENRIRAMEGEPPLTLVEFAATKLARRR
ncbi:hypothetical protein KIP88_02655 [Bradyrhizobium sp. SRL28]|uniref:hypothetical protein n=1 Tax=Bradyrhizobium sp. SRL28 TaxID=2836178 RepID=UPI001BDEBFF7|nr:hypothetical protein [Bradyrhizobium sp. SRL28]MBT1509391.1 hypothetical protein [Bradyrhizobium sp. SRL28]